MMRWLWPLLTYHSDMIEETKPVPVNLTHEAVEVPHSIALKTLTNTIPDRIGTFFFFNYLQEYPAQSHDFMMKNNYQFCFWTTMLINPNTKNFLISKSPVTSHTLERLWLDTPANTFTDLKGTILLRIYAHALCTSTHAPSLWWQPAYPFHDTEAELNSHTLLDGSHRFGMMSGGCALQSFRACTTSCGARLGRQRKWLIWLAYLSTLPSQPIVFTDYWKSANIADQVCVKQ